MSKDFFVQKCFYWKCLNDVAWWVPRMDSLSAPVCTKFNSRKPKPFSKIDYEKISAVIRDLTVLIQLLYQLSYPATWIIMCWEMKDNKTCLITAKDTNAK